MKPIKIILSMACASLMLSACTDLDERIFDKVPMDNYGKTESEIQTITAAVYASLRGLSDATTGIASYPTCEFVFFLDEAASDEACIPARGDNWYDNGVYFEMQRHNWASNNKLLESYWKYCYNGIISCNSVLYQIEKSGQSGEALTRIGAEPRALRAYYYWLLLNTFGDVPIVTDFEQTELPAKSDRKQVYAFVESELKDVMPYLSATKSYGRFTQDVANTLLARLYINAETYTGEAKWQECLDACDKVKNYSLEANYKSNFTDATQPSSSEIIFAIPYDHKQGTVGNYLNSMSFNDQQWKAFAVKQYGGNWSANGICAQPGVYSSFDENDVRRESMLIGEQRSKADGSTIMTTNGNQLIYTEEVTSIDNRKDLKGSECQGARLFKYEVRDDEEWERDYDWVLMRYAEILLMKAECYVRLGTPDAGTELVNQVRRRAGLKDLSSINLDDLDKEWLHEFIFEGLRRTVNVRFGTYFKEWWEKPVSEYDATKASRVFPIPANVLTLNPALKQNPDYEGK